MENSLPSIIESSNLDISPSGLHQRFNEGAVEFLKEQLARAIETVTKSQSELEASVVELFSRICVLDSTGWQLPPKLKSTFPGSGGCSSKAGCKVQFGYDLKSSTVFNIEIVSGNNPDQKYASKLPSLLKPNDLFLADLGYFAIKVFNQYIEDGVSFISRYLTGTLVYTSDGTKQINLGTFLTKHKKDKFIDIPVQIGGKAKVSCRLVAVKLPPQQVNQKLRNLNKAAKKKGKTVSKRSKQLAQWNIYITNVGPEKLSVSQISKLYRLRWSVELIFKQFKSTLHLHHWNHGNDHRLLCEIMGTLIIAVIILSLHGMLQAYAWSSSNIEISFDRLFKFAKNFAAEFFPLLYATPTNFRRFWRTLVQHALAFSKKNSSLKRPSSLLAVTSSA